MVERTALTRVWVAAVTLFLAVRTVAAAIPAPAPAPTVERTASVVSYGAGVVKGALLNPSDWAPGASGSIKAAPKGGSVTLKISVKGLPDPTTFGPEYLAYIAWTVTPEGRARNLGEVPVKKGGGSLSAGTQSQSFGVVVTAEPYFAAAVPSEVVVLTNGWSEKDAAKAAPVDTKFATFARGTYAGPGLAAPDPAAGLPPELYQARNAVRIAESFGAKTFSSDVYKRAADNLAQAETYQQDKKLKKMAPAKAREAVQSAEAARLLAVRQIDDARAAAQQADAAARADAARADAQKAQEAAAEEARRRAEAEAVAADEVRRRAQAEALASSEGRKRAEAEAAAEAEAQRRAAAEFEKQTLRAKLLQQFNNVLETRDSARGLIVSMGDVLFDVDKFTLRPQARERLAKLSGIVLANPGLKLAIEGHTDATGSDDYNMKLSQNRASAVQDYLVKEKVPAESVSANGFGKTRPVAPNDTADGRQKNRRVEIVVSGDIIGTEIEEQKAAATPAR